MKKVIRVGTFQRQEVLLTVQKQFVGNALHQWSNTRLYLAGTKGQHQTAGEGMQDTSGDGERTPPEDTSGDAELDCYLQGCEVQTSYLLYVLSGNTPAHTCYYHNVSWDIFHLDY